MGIFHEIEYHFCAKKSCNWLVVVVVDVCIDTIIDMCVMKSKKYHEKKGENGLEELAECQFYYYYCIRSRLNQENFTNALMKFLEIKENSVVALMSYLIGTRAKWRNGTASVCDPLKCTR